MVTEFADATAVADPIQRLKCLELRARIVQEVRSFLRMPGTTRATIRRAALARIQGAWFATSIPMASDRFYERKSLHQEQAALFNEFDHVRKPLLRLQVGHDEGTFPAHAQGVLTHHIERSPDHWRQVAFIDDKKI